ncbi:hypothetical protein CK203_060088 [Vitis vinifera]|uniref:Uncharacterized protein n=1 Tax=Vitis vinifera TaxID=29760 RepID=A0A438GK73_VITVI|nr:hypothetical protein CK203_060088 [Vitis vinifera]
MQWKEKREAFTLTNDEEAKKEESPKLNLKPLPNDLKYAYLVKISILIEIALEDQEKTTFTCPFEKGIVLGHVVSRKGIEVDKAKIELIVNLPPPTNVKEVNNFLVM